MKKIFFCAAVLLLTTSHANAQYVGNVVLSTFDNSSAAFTADYNTNGQSAHIRVWVTNMTTNAVDTTYAWNLNWTATSTQNVTVMVSNLQPGTQYKYNVGIYDQDMYGGEAYADGFEPTFTTTGGGGNNNSGTFLDFVSASVTSGGVDVCYIAYGNGNMSMPTIMMIDDWGGVVHFTNSLSVQSDIQNTYHIPYTTDGHYIVTGYTEDDMGNGGSADTLNVYLGTATSVATVAQKNGHDKVKIIDISGKVVCMTTYGSPFPEQVVPGNVYILQMLDRKDRVIQTQKFVYVR